MKSVVNILKDGSPKYDDYMGRLFNSRYVHPIEDGQAILINTSMGVIEVGIDFGGKYSPAYPYVRIVTNVDNDVLTLLEESYLSHNRVVLCVNEECRHPFWSGPLIVDSDGIGLLKYLITTISGSEDIHLIPYQ